MAAILSKNLTRSSSVARQRSQQNLQNQWPLLSLFREVKPGGRVALMGRAQNIFGPYETRQLIHVTWFDREPNQGGLVETPAGDWWFLTHQGSGGFWEGRTACC